MDNYAMKIISAGPPYPHNLERLAQFLELRTKGVDKKSIQVAMNLSEQTYYNLKKQLDDRDLTKMDKPFPFIVPQLFLNRSVIPTTLTALLHFALNNNRQDIVERLKIKYKEELGNYVTSFSDAVAVFALASNTFDAFINMDLKYNSTEEAINSAISKLELP